MPVSRIHDRQLMAIGGLCAAGGIYFLAAGLGFTPPPSGPAEGPQWLAACIGLIFIAGGVVVTLRGWLNVPDSQSELPADTPRAFLALQFAAVIVACAGLAVAATWVAFGPGSRHFVLPLPVWGTWGETIGRAAFAVGAMMAWLVTVLFARAGASKVFGRKS